MNRDLVFVDDAMATLIALVLFVVYNSNGRETLEAHETVHGTYHERLSDGSDMQIRRCLTAGASPQNYSLVPVIADEDR